MRLLVDSHALLWFVIGLERLSPTAKAALSAEENDVFVSAASAWEICTKHRIGKLPQASSLASGFERNVTTRGFLVLDVTMRHAEQAGNMEGQHKDPFDRMLIAQALLEEMTVVSNDFAFDSFGIARVW